MTKDEYKDGLEIIVKGKRAIANGLELCADGSYIVHAFFPHSPNGVQWRVPIGKVQIDKEAEVGL